MSRGSQGPAPSGKPRGGVAMLKCCRPITSLANNGSIELRSVSSVSCPRHPRATLAWWQWRSELRGGGYVGAVMHCAVLSILAPLLAVFVATNASGEIISGIDFPAGSESFADAVLRYEPLFQDGLGPLSPYDDPTRALGRPDVTSGVGMGFLSLGLGGLVELLFVDNVLTNSGDSSHDIHVFEVGADVEATLVAVRPTVATAALLGLGFDTNSDGFYEIGEVVGGTGSLNIDATFLGFSPGVLAFDAVQLVDNDFNPGTTSGTHGADINAVGAISSGPAVPEPSSFIMLSLGLMNLASGRWRRPKRRITA